MEKMVKNKSIYSSEKIGVAFLNQRLSSNLVFLGLVLFCCTGFFAVFFIDICFKFADYITALIWVVFLFSLLILNPKFVVKYMYLIFLIITNLIGVFIIENNNLYLYELRVQSKDYNSLLIISWTHFVFLLFLYFFDDKFENTIVYSMSKDKERWVFKGREVGDIVILFIGFAFIIINCILLFLVFKNGTAHQLKIDRFEYGDRFLFGFWGSLNNIISYIIPIIAILFIKRFRIVPLIMLGLYFAYLFLIGIKFGTFLTSICFLLPIFFVENNQVNIKK